MTLASASDLKLSIDPELHKKCKEFGDMTLRLLKIVSIQRR